MLTTAPEPLIIHERIAPSFFTAYDFDLMQPLMQIKQVCKGNGLFWEGEEAGQLLYIFEGKVKLKKTAETGRELILAFTPSGDWIGEIGGYDGDVYSYSAEVVEDATVGVLQQHDLERLFQQHSELALRFVRWMGWKQKMLHAKMLDLLLYGKSGALASTLIQMCHSFGVVCEQGIRLDLQVSHAELADVIGSTRENVNRILNAWKKDGTITVADGQMIVRQPERLQLLCECQPQRTSAVSLI